MTNLAELQELAPKPIWDGVAARFVQGDHLTMAVVELEPNSVVPQHHHPNEQLGIVLRGTLSFRVGDETKQLGPGGTWRILGDVPHEARTGAEGAVVIDVFTPVRSDWERIEDDPMRPPRWPA
jgi:quercetin dioxygenase-like cupin family protein